jgi:predicted membrane protein
MRTLIWGILLLSLGILLLLDNLGIADFTSVVEEYWPVLLIGWGVMIMLRRKRSIPAQSAPPGTTPPPPGAGSSSSFPGDLLHQSSIFGDVRVSVASQAFKGGSVSTLFGEAFIDLSGSLFAEGSHELRLQSVFGNTRVILPRDAAVVVSGSVVMGHLTLFGLRRGGIASDIRAESPGYNHSDRRLHISFSKFFGNGYVE